MPEWVSTEVVTRDGDGHVGTLTLDNRINLSLQQKGKGKPPAQGKGKPPAQGNKGKPQTFAQAVSGPPPFGSPPLVLLF